MLDRIIGSAFLVGIAAIVLFALVRCETAPPLRNETCADCEARCKPFPVLVCKPTHTCLGCTRDPIAVQCDCDGRR